MFDKEFLKIAIAVIAGLILYDLVVKKLVLKSSFEDSVEEEEIE